MTNNGITAPKGFFASGIACGIKKGNALDLALVFSEYPCLAAGMFTRNRVKGHSLMLTKQNLSSHLARAVLINSGNANACVGSQGYADAQRLAVETAQLLGVPARQVLVGSTGVIGHRLPMDRILAGLPIAVDSLSKDHSNAARAILTTDTVVKESTLSFHHGGKEIIVGGMAKGSGMIHPRMATLIGVVSTDACISLPALKNAVRDACEKSFNRISVDGDTSVCDMFLVLANGASDYREIQLHTPEYSSFSETLQSVAVSLAKAVVKDGEGSTKFITIQVLNAKNGKTARRLLEAISRSPLVKTAFYGEDANWGRILTAMGNSGISFDPQRIKISIGSLLLFQEGVAIPFLEAEAKRVLGKPEIDICIDLMQGDAADTMWTCDMSEEYVRINAKYRS